jgi:hypothetical protein
MQQLATSQSASERLKKHSSKEVLQKEVENNLAEKMAEFGLVQFGFVWALGFNQSDTSFVV